MKAPWSQASTTGQTGLLLDSKAYGTKRFLRPSYYSVAMAVPKRKIYPKEGRKGVGGGQPES